MNNDNALSTIAPKQVGWFRLNLPRIELGLLPAKLSKRLWVDPTEFLVVISAATLAQWALAISASLRPALPTPSQRGPKPVYQDYSIMPVALVQVAWLMSYESDH